MISPNKLGRSPFPAKASQWMLVGLRGGAVVTPPGYYRSLTVNAAMVPATQTDFPVLVSITDATLKTVANGGHVQRSDGFDIGFFSDSAGTTPLKWEIEKYMPSTGELVAWVKIANLTTSSVFFVRYGNPANATDQSDPVNVWTNSFAGVYHLGNGTTLSVADSLGAINGTNVNGITAVTGKVDGGGNFVHASTQYISLGSPTGTSAVTISCWANAVSLPAAYNAIAVRYAAGAANNEFFVKSSGKLAVFLETTGSGAPSYDGIGAITLSTGTWYYLVAAYDSTNGIRTYVNTAVDALVPPDGGGLVTTASPLRIGSDPLTASREWNGILDEVRISSVARSANWITTEYNNQNAPGTFLTLGPET